MTYGYHTDRQTEAAKLRGAVGPTQITKSVTGKLLTDKET